MGKCVNLSQFTLYHQARIGSSMVMIWHMPCRVFALAVHYFSQASEICRTILVYLRTILVVAEQAEINQLYEGRLEIFAIQPKYCLFVLLYCKNFQTPLYVRPQINCTPQSTRTSQHQTSAANTIDALIFEFIQQAFYSNFIQYQQTIILLTNKTNVLCICDTGVAHLQ